MIRVTVDPVFGFCMVEEPGFHAACSIHTASLQLFTQQLVSTVTALKPKARGVCAYTFLRYLYGTCSNDAPTSFTYKQPNTRQVIENTKSASRDPY